jgi:trigger factor
MANAVTATVTELPESRVRVRAEVAAAEVQRRLEQKASALGRDLRIPGFRKGKVPAPVVIRRVGRDAVLDQTVRDSLGRWYVEALDASGIEPVGDPELDLDSLPQEGESLTFSIEIGVLPTARLGEYRGVEAPRREPVADPEDVEHELGALRERLARLETAERAADAGDFVVIDYVGTVEGEPFAGGEGRDELLELGSGRLVPGFEEQLTGATAGEHRAVTLTFPEDYRAEELAGREARFEVDVKEVKEKHLPELDDDFAVDAAGLDSLDELRADIESRLRAADERRAEQEFREAALDAAVERASIEIPAHLVAARAQELWERMLHTLSHQGISKDAYLNIAGKDEQQILSEAEPDAERALRREAVIAAVIEAERTAPDDIALHEALEPTAEREGSSPDELVQMLERAGRLDAVRQDLAAQRAVDLIAEHAKPIPVARARAREKLWTPGKERAQAGQIWTPEKG